LGLIRRSDGVLILNGWSDHPPARYTVDLQVHAGPHTLALLTEVAKGAFFNGLPLKKAPF